MNHVNRTILVVGVLLAVPGGVVGQINQGQIDTFESGTTLGWSIGLGFAGPTVQPGGPNGPTDHFLQLVTGQAGGPPRYTIFNQAQWSGNYNSPLPPGSNPVNGIEMDIANFSATAIATRIAIKTGGGQTPGYSFIGGIGTNGAHNIPADGQWHHVVFPIDTSTMAAVTDPFGTPPPPLSQLLDNVGELRILHSVQPSLMGDFLVGRVGVDNIRAVFIVPEPTGVLAGTLIVAGAAAWLRRRTGRGRMASS